MVHASTTPASEVLTIIGWLTERETVYQVNGGWGVDALVGRQTREHGDLDVFVDAGVVPDLIEWLASRGYEPVTDWLPIRIELASEHGRVDVHPMAIRPNGDGVQQGFEDAVFTHPAVARTRGSIDGVPVIVGTAERLRELRNGYDPRPEDEHDLELLSHLNVGEDPARRAIT